jgi:2-keto-4-pentenoate hydratase
LPDAAHDAPEAGQAAALLLRARDPAHRLIELPEALRPGDVAAAVAIQRIVAAARGPIGGWKVGASGPESEPNCAPMALAGIQASPAALPPGVDRAVEAEVAFCLGQDLPPRRADYTREEIIAALATAHPAIEWLESRFFDPGTVDRLSLLADGLQHGGFVWGAGVADWPRIDFANETVMQVSGGSVLRGTGNPAGDMIRLIQWLADVGAVWAGGLFAGQFITCGSWTGKAPVRPGQEVQVTFPSLGEARLTA